MDDRKPYQCQRDDEYGLLLTDLAQRSERALESAFRRDRIVGPVLDAGQEVEVVLDAGIERLHRAIEDAAAKGLATMPACKKGCSHCCRRTVEATAPEVLNAVRFAEETFAPERKAALKARLEQFRLETEPLRPAGLAESQTVCPFLDEDLCSIYSARPLSCRGMCSIDVEACKKIAAGEAGPETRPMLRAQFELESTVRTGMRVGLMFEFADTALLDFGLAAGIALDSPEAVERYLNGDDPFSSARLPYDLEPFDIGELSLRFKPMVPVFGPEKPSGNLSQDLATGHRKFVEKAVREGDFVGAFASFSGHSAAHAMARIDVPRIARSEAEVLESREAFVRAMRDFRSAGFRPGDAFDALSIHQTMSLTYQGLDDLSIMREHGKLMTDIASGCLPDLCAMPGKKRIGRLRVGYISANLNRSNGGHWALGWLKNHGPEIETYALLLGWRFDSVTAQFRESADHFFWLTRNVPENAAFVKSLGLDVLVYTDIGLHARNTQYSALRLAPLQCTAWGHPDTTGLSTIDYYLSSEMMEPENGQDLYSERLIRLPRLGLCYQRPNVQPSNLDRAHFGIPEGEKLLFMAQANMKMLPQHDLIYAEICERVGSPLTLLGSSSAGDSAVLKKRLEAAGVPTRWLPYQEVPNYLALMKLADVSLDTPMWSGGNTTVQALTLGTPVVALPGPFMRSRHSLAMLQLAGAPGLIAKDLKDYVDLACDFGRQRELMRDVNPDALYEDIGTVRALDEFLLSDNH